MMLAMKLAGNIVLIAATIPLALGGLLAVAVLFLGATLIVGRRLVACRRESVTSMSSAPPR